MPTIKSAEKRLRQSEKRRQRNKAVRSGYRTLFRRIQAMDDPDAAREELSRLYGALDRAASKGVIHPNKAARKKSQAAAHVESLTG